MCSNVPCYATVCSIMTVQPIYNLNISVIVYGYLSQKIIMSLAKSIVNASERFLILTVSNKTLNIYSNYYYFNYCNFDHCIVTQILLKFFVAPIISYQVINGQANDFRRTGKPFHESCDKHSFTCFAEAHVLLLCTRRVTFHVWYSHVSYVII